MQSDCLLQDSILPDCSNVILTTIGQSTGTNIIIICKKNYIQTLIDRFSDFGDAACNTNISGNTHLILLLKHIEILTQL